MKLKDVDSKRQNFIISVVLLPIPMIALACRFDYYYDLNDDVLMKEILSGNYTGVPEGHNIQMLWLISAAISLLYRIVRIAPWYGVFLCTCQFGALLLILNRSFAICTSRKAKLTVGLVETLLFFSMMMEHLVAVQYTVTCTMLVSDLEATGGTGSVYPKQYSGDSACVSGISDPVRNASASTSDDLCRRGCEVEL